MKPQRASLQRLALGIALGGLLALMGCAGMLAHQEGKRLLAEGKVDPGLAKLEEAVRHEPRNVEYRIALGNQRATVVNRLIAQGDASRRLDELDAAEAAYRKAQTIDENNLMARQGLRSVQTGRAQRERIAEAEALLKRGSESELMDALEKLRPVLAETPNHKLALQLKSRVDEARARQASPEARLAAAYRRPVTLEFRDAPLRSVFDFISKVSGLNFFFDKEMRSDLRTSIAIRNSSIEEAVRLLLSMNQLEQKILNENSLLIYPATSAKLKEHQTLTVKTFYLTNADVKAVMNSIKTIVKTKDIVLDERLGVIIMRDTPAAVRMAERIVAVQDLTDPEVMLEVEVLEIKRSRLLELGVQWPAQLTLSPLSVGNSPLTLQALRGITSATTQATIGGASINARSDDQDGNILANPRIRVRNREKAKVLIGDKVPIITTTSGSTGFVSESVAYVDVGLKLEVEPTVHLDDQVAIKVNLEVSNLVREIVSKSGTQSFQIGTRGANTLLRLQDGETQILAGLISDEDRSTSNKVPLLGSLPLVGRLFGSQKDDTQRTEILLSITPRIVRSIPRLNLQETEFDSGTEANIGVQSPRLSKLSAPSREPSRDSGVGAPAADAKPEAVSARVSWVAPAQVKVGEQFSAVLHWASSTPVRGVPLLLGYDPKLLQVLGVQEGDFFKREAGATTFTQRVDPAQGRIIASVTRQNPSGTDPGVKGAGAVMTVVLRALAALPPGSATQLQLLSASPDSNEGLSLALPLVQSIQVVP